MGPLLFILYINGFENCLESTILNLYVDLTDMKNELEKIKNWVRINKLKSNARKSEGMAIDHRRQLFRVGNDLPDPVQHPNTILW